jgi:hypothetical protein
LPSQVQDKLWLFKTFNAMTDVKNQRDGQLKTIKLWLTLGGHLHFITGISDTLICNWLAGWPPSKPGGWKSSVPAEWDGHDDFAWRWSWAPDPTSEGDSSDRNNLTW